MQNRRHVFHALAMAGVMGILPASAQQATPPATAPATTPVAPPAAVLAPAADAKVIVVGSVVQLRSGGPKMTVIELSATIAGVQWHQENSGFKKESFPVAALKLVDADSDDDEDEDEDEDE